MGWARMGSGSVSDFAQHARPHSRARGTHAHPCVAQPLPAPLPRTHPPTHPPTNPPSLRTRTQAGCTLSQARTLVLLSLCQSVLVLLLERVPLVPRPLLCKVIKAARGGGVCVGEWG